MPEINLPPFRIAGTTNPGRRRRHRPNEDSILLPTRDHDPKVPPLIAVADGMGGHQGGALASRIVVNVLRHCYYKEAPTETNWEGLLVRCIREAHQRIRVQAMEQGFPEMGSTVVAAVLLPGQAVVANVGDSRAYLRNEAGLHLVSRDHSVVARMVERGEITELQALRHPHRHRLTQALSARREDVQPYVTRVTFQPGDILLLCSDGLWEAVPHSILEDFLGRLPPLIWGVHRLVELANRFQGPDNISVILARYQPPDQTMWQLPEEETVP